jgi:hypothetical protein
MSTHVNRAPHRERQTAMCGQPRRSSPGPLQVAAPGPSNAIWMLVAVLDGLTTATSIHIAAVLGLVGVKPR